jgi:mannose-6-phosphate isomerase
VRNGVKDLPFLFKVRALSLGVHLDPISPLLASRF